MSPRTLLNIFWAVVIFSIIGGIIYFRMTHPRFVRLAVRRLSQTELNTFLAEMGAITFSRGFQPQQFTPGFYSYQKAVKPNAGVALLLLLLCIIPGILYVILGGSTQSVSVKMVDTGGQYDIELKAPSLMNEKIRDLLSPYELHTT